jgi:branched-chain amino acid transport system permease protein
MTTIDLALAGISIGAVAALSGIGLLITYRTNGVLNLAQGGIATLIAYLFRQFVVVWHWPLWLAAVMSLLLIAPFIGLLLERFVFRPLARRRASAAESLVSSLGLLVLCVGMCAAIWGLGSRTDAPSLFPTDPVSLPGGTSIGQDALAELGVVLLVCIALGLLTNRTRFGRQVRAVVDDRQLAEMSGLPADRVAAFGWALGTTLAGLTGILLAPKLQLTPYGLTLLVLETFAVVVAARLSSMTIAVVTALALGIGQSELERVNVSGNMLTLVQSVRSNLFVAALLVLLLVVPKLRELGGDAGSTGRFSSRGAPPAVPAGGRARRDVFAPLASAALLLSPLTFAPADLRSAFTIPALALIFLSLVVVTGYSGQVSLGVAGYAGLGALLSTKLAAGQLFGLPAMNGLLALLLGALMVAPIGFISGYPAIRRRGLALALTTFAVGAVVSRFVFEQPTFATGLFITRPFVGHHQLGDKGFYLVELCCLGLGLLLVRNMHHGRLGRALLSVRDDSAGAAAVGVDVRGLKLLSFTASSVVAGLGGALLVQAAGSFDTSTFDPLQSLLWFTAVIVFGADSAVGAVVAAAFMVTIDTLAPSGSSTLAVGILALALGWMPGGLAAEVRRLFIMLGQRVTEEMREVAGPVQHRGRPSLNGHAAPDGTGPGPVAPGWLLPAGAGPAGRVGDPRLTPFGQALVARVRMAGHSGPTSGVTGSGIRGSGT